mmetsp:Transcript_22737/g.25313  ORF Transcript_22737/g.25313 Transcript_22737/m.25313 type:complete len:432 (-) Transcript_22737:52-1347(-)
MTETTDGTFKLFHAVHEDSKVMRDAINDPTNQLQDVQTQHGDTLLHVAVSNNNLKLVERLCTRIDVNLSNKSGETPLHIAASKGNTDIIRYLIEQGANINARTKAHLTAATIAKIYHNEKDHIHKHFSSLYGIENHVTRSDLVPNEHSGLFRSLTGGQQFTATCEGLLLMQTSSRELLTASKKTKQTDIQSHASTKINSTSGEDYMYSEGQYILAIMVTQLRVKTPSLFWKSVALDPKRRKPLKLIFNKPMKEYRVVITGTPKLSRDSFDEISFGCGESSEELNEKYSKKGLMIHHSCPENSKYDIILAFAFPGKYKATFVHKPSAQAVKWITIYVTTCRARAGCTVDTNDYISFYDSEEQMQAQYEIEKKKKRNIEKQQKPQSKRRSNNTKQEKCRVVKKRRISTFFPDKKNNDECFFQKSSRRLSDELS